METFWSPLPFEPSEHCSLLTSAPLPLLKQYTKSLCKMLLMREKNDFRDVASSQRFTWTSDSAWVGCKTATADVGGTLMRSHTFPPTVTGRLSSNVFLPTCREGKGSTEITRSHTAEVPGAAEEPAIEIWEWRANWGSNHPFPKHFLVSVWSFFY